MLKKRTLIIKQDKGKGESKMGAIGLLLFLVLGTLYCYCVCKINDNEQDRKRDDEAQEKYFSKR